MRESPKPWRMTFILPDSLYGRVPRGRFQPCIHGVVLAVHGAGLVTAEARSVVIERFLILLPVGSSRRASSSAV